MRKTINEEADKKATPFDGEWLELDAIADVELTSEDSEFPIEAALIPDRGGQGWRAATAGKQTIRLTFAKPQVLRRILLDFHEGTAERTQEYRLLWSGEDNTAREILRQQWNFSPAGSTRQTEEHELRLPAVKTLELAIIPDIRGGGIASLAALRLA